MSCQDPSPHSYSSLSDNENATPSGRKGNLVGDGATGTLGGTGLEAVKEAAVDIAQGAHAAGAGGLAALGLLTPVELAGLGSRVAAVGTSRLLDVERPLATTTAQSVRLVVALSEARGTLSHLELWNWQFR